MSLPPCVECGVPSKSYLCPFCMERVPYVKQDDPMVVALKAHAAACGICRGALAKAGDTPGRIKVFMELCGEGQRVIRDAPR